MADPTISAALAAALADLVRAAAEAEAAPTDGQAARRAIERAAIVADLARREGFGGDGDQGQIRT